MQPGADRPPQPRHVLITGASSGLGAALACAYAAPGRTLTLIGRDPVRLAAVADDCRGSSATVLTVLADVADPSAMERAVGDAEAARPLDLVIANAGISGGDGSDATLRAQQILRVNVEGVVNTVEPALPTMIKRGRGQLALMSSLAGFRGMPSAPAYCASKAAVRVYGEALRARLRAHGVRVAILCPGFVETPLTARNPFPMPLIMPAGRAAARIKLGLDAGRTMIAFPRRYRLALGLLGLLPARLTDPWLARIASKE
jgi:short-subunit dehydrogenase